MAVVKPFRAVRYDEEAAGPLASLIAPPYDVISPDERAEYLSRSPHNVVHLTLPDSEEEAGRRWREWRDGGVLAQDETPSVWELEQDHDGGPGGLRRRRRGLFVSLRVEPYENGVVLPHERTHREAKEGRLRLLRAVRAQLEPILLVYEGPPPVSATGPPDVELGNLRLRRAGPIDVERFFADTQFLIADGHHRYETALAFHREDGSDESASMLAVLVSASDPGLHVRPTHRIAGRAGRVDGTEIEKPGGNLPGVVVYRGGRYYLLEGDGLDVETVDRAGPEDVRYTPSRQEAEEAVDRGEAEAAFLVRPVAVEDVFERARRGEALPPKTTFFDPKLPSGLLFHPLEP